MTSYQRRESVRRQRGEGKVGCIVSLLILVSAVAIGLKAVPIYWTDNELKDAAKDIASRASVLQVEAIQLQLRSKAQELGIGEAMVRGAIKVTKSGNGDQGLCTIILKYSRKIDLYGVYTWPVDVNTTVASPYLGGL